MNEMPFASVKTSRRFELGWNRLQGVIEIVVAIVVVAGLLGLFGTGPLSSAKTVVPGRPITIDYQRILRRTVRNDISISFAAPPSTSEFEVELPTSFLQKMDIVSTSPRASAMRTQAHGITYVFDVGDPSGGEITLSTKAKGVGTTASHLLVDGAPVVLHQFIWP